MSLPVLTTKRLVLRPVEMGDAEAIAELGGRDFEIARWLTGVSWPYRDGEAEAFLSKIADANPLKTEAVFAVTLGGVFIGVCALEAPGDLDEFSDCPTIGYWVGRAFQGFGYTQEAAMAVLEWGFSNHECDAIAARAFEDNTASRSVLRKLGFKPAGKTTRFAKALDRKVDCIVVRLDRADFERARVAA
ncbi:GNAT family N-acetyltransferase [Roseibium sp. RKSG952]|uniref:GNAT family N-acetyltransferase n=1 Tax=Roseibium sp. RKSG952 TaxID=2529384 RepID=UPI0012BCEF15|nr:GNAT family N-acetyltransferase [Roseibium sp. RKSG952]MTH95113.1 N-acetyltransferase [Roseibium sp. RKSG952]